MGIIVSSQRTASALLSRVPEVTVYFWVIKVLCPTVGESAADFLDVDLGFGLTATSVVTGVDIRPGGLWQTVVVAAAVVVVGATGYLLRTCALHHDTSSTAGQSPLGDLSQFRAVTQDTLALLNTGNQSAARTRVDDLETTWDHAQARRRAKNRVAWNTVDDKIDTVLSDLRGAHPNPHTERSAPTTLLTALA